MCTSTTSDPTSTSTDEIDIDLAEAISKERAANNPPATEVVILIPDGVAYKFDREGNPSALRLRIVVGGTR